MTWEAFYEALKAGRRERIYCLYGPEEYVKKEALSALRAKWLPKGLEMMNETVLEDASARQIIEAAETLPMMAERRMVVVREWAPLLSAKAKNAAAEAEQIAAWLPNSPDSCCLVFSLRGMPDGRGKAMQAMQKHAACVSFEFLADAKLVQWMNREMKQEGKRIDSDAARQLVFMAGRNMTRLSEELLKLSAFVGEKESVTVRDVEQMVTPTLECTVFQMMDSLMEGDKRNAHKLLAGMLESGETRVGVLAMLTWHVRNLEHLREMAEQGARLPEMERKLGLSHFVAEKAGRQAKRFSLPGLRAAHRACLDTEFDIKSGKLRDTLALDYLMLSLGNLR